MDILAFGLVSTLVRGEPSPPVAPVPDGSAQNAGQARAAFEGHRGAKRIGIRCYGTPADAPVHAVASAPNKAARNNGHLRQQKQYYADQH